MGTVVTHDMLVRRALIFLAEGRRERPDIPLEKLLDEAGERFNLSPADGAALERLYREIARNAAAAASSGAPGND